jgi:hypothetical protein
LLESSGFNNQSLGSSHTFDLNESFKSLPIGETTIVNNFILPASTLKKGKMQRPMSAYQQKMNLIKQTRGREDMMCGGKQMKIKSYLDTINQQTWQKKMSQ